MGGGVGDPWSRKSSGGSSSSSNGDVVEGSSTDSSLKTLNLQLDEVAHIRSVLTKAQLESVADTEVREGVERGRVCFVCMTTKFGGLFSFSKGQKCQMCKQMVCAKCCSKVCLELEVCTLKTLFTNFPLYRCGYQPSISLLPQCLP